MELYIKQKFFSIGDKYSIFDENGNEVYYAEGEVFSVGAKISLYDLNGNELFFIKQKVFRLMPEYEIYKGNTLYAIVKKNFTFFRPSITVTGIDCELSAEGSLWAMDFSISKNGAVIGYLSKKWLTFGDSYCLSVNNPENVAFFTILSIAIDNCHHDGDN